MQERGENISSGGLVHLATPNGFRPFDADHGDIRGRWYTAAGACCVHWLFAAGQRRPETYTLLESTKMSSNLKLTLTADRTYKAAHARWQRASDFDQKWKQAARDLLEYNNGEGLPEDLRNRALEMMTYPSLILRLSAGIFGCEMNGTWHDSAIQNVANACLLKFRGEVEHSCKSQWLSVVEGWLLTLEEGKDVREVKFKEVLHAALLHECEQAGWLKSPSYDDEFIL